MTTEKKHHYRKVFKSDHLGSADLEDLIEENKSLFFTIAYVKQEMGASVAGKKGNFNIAYFVEPLKPLVLNATNSKTVKALAGGSPFVEDWKQVPVELYIDANVKMKGEVVGGVRIRGGVAGKQILTKDMDGYNKAINYVKGGGSIEDIKKKYTLTAEIETSILSEIKTA